LYIFGYLAIPIYNKLYSSHLVLKELSLTFPSACAIKYFLFWCKICWNKYKIQWN